MAFDFGTVVNLLGGAAVAVLGGLVAALRPRSRANAWFSLFAIAFGLHFVVWNAATGLEVPTLEIAGVLAIGRALAIVGILGFVSSLREPTGPPRFFAAAVAFLPVVYGAAVRLGGIAPAEGWAGAAGSLAWWGVFASLHYLILLLALGYAREDAGGRARSVLMSAGLLVYVGYASPSDVVSASLALRDPAAFVHYALLYAELVLVAGLWLRNAVGSDRPAPARRVALLALGMPVLAFLVVDLGFHGLGLLGMTRVLMVSVLAYAIVRHQLLGLDVKIRWTIANGTIAATFIATFFVVSALAQEWFDDAFGTTAGVLAAGAIVFALAPLQRFAERLAYRVLPAEDGGGGPRPQAEAAYRRAVSLALRGGDLPAGGERELFRLAEEIGVPAGRAYELLEAGKRDAAEARGAEPDGTPRHAQG